MAVIAQYIKLFHILSGIAMITGLIGRELARSQARRSQDIQIFQAMIQLSGRFENLLVIPGSTSVFIFGLIVSWMRGWPLLGFLQGASTNWLLVSLILYLSLIPLILFVFLPRGKVFEKALAEALEKGQVTDTLLATFNDRVVYRAHIYEALVVAWIIFLMVIKPF
jgi:uncharacterized membrane protein